MKVLHRLLLHSCSQPGHSPGEAGLLQGQGSSVVSSEIKQCKPGVVYWLITNGLLVGKGFLYVEAKVRLFG